MKIFIDNDTNKPTYLRLYKVMRDRIMDGIYPRGSKLPSKRTVREETGVSVVTVEHAYGLLEEEGYIEARERSGYFVIFSKGDGFVSDVNPIPRSIPHYVTDKVYDFPFSVLTRTMRRVINEYSESIMERSPGQGCILFREAISEYLRRNKSIDVTVDRIVVGSGAEHLYSHIVGLLGRDRVYGIESPSYEKIKEVYLSSGVDVEYLPLGADGIRSDALASTNASVLHVSPYRSFPTGITATASKRHEYVRWSMGDGKYIVEDDYESEFSVLTKAEANIFAMSDLDNVIYVNTFSRTVSPALRVGYMVLPEHLVEVYREKLGYQSCSVPTFEQYVLTELILSGDLERHINRGRRLRRREQTVDKTK